MRKMKRFIAVLVAMVMVLGMGTTAFAADYDTGNVKISGIADADTVYLYKIADAEVGENNAITYKNFNNYGTSYTIDTIAAIASDNYADKSESGSAAKTLADNLAAAAASGTATYTKTGAEAAAGFDVDAGYYVAIVKGTNASVIYQNMLIDTTPTVENNAYVATNVNFAVKKYTEEIKKTVTDPAKAIQNATTVDGYKRGDYIPFTVETTIPNYPSNSTYATMIIADEPTGITIENTTSHPVVVKVGGTEVEEGTTTYSVDTTGGNLKITFVKEYILANATKAVVVTYEGQLTALAKLDGSAMNKATLEYNPNPYDEETNKIDPVVYVYTYGYVFDKVKENADGTTEPLAGAVFTLYLDNNGAKGEEFKDADGNVVTSTTAIVSGKAYAYFNELPAGTYWVSETTVPAGLNPVADFSFEVNKDNATADNPATTDVEETNYLVNTTSLVDTLGVQLPTTGGIGTTMFYVVGSVLVVGAVVLLISKKRMAR